MRIKLDPSVKRVVPADVVSFLDPVSISVGFNLTAEEALSFFRDKGLKTSFDYRDLVKGEHEVAFTVAKMLDMDMLRDVREKLDESIATGTSMEDFRKELEPYLRQKGWWGRQTVKDPITGKVLSSQQLGSAHRLRTIFRTNMQSAYATGQWEQMSRHAETAPWLLYDAVDDNRTRLEHAQFDGVLLPIDHPFWDTHYAPNGHNCRCGVLQLDDAELMEMGLVPGEVPEIKWTTWTNPRTGITERVPEGIDPTFAHNPGKSRMEPLKEILREKYHLLPEDMRNAATANAAKQIILSTENVLKELPEGALSSEITREEAKQAGRKILRKMEEMVSEVARKSNLDMQRSRKFKHVFDSVHSSHPAMVPIAEEFRDRLVKQLERFRPVSTPAVVEGKGKGALAVQKASKRFPDDWTRAADGLGKLYIRYSNHRGWHVSLPKPTRSIKTFGHAYKALKGDPYTTFWPKGTGFIVTDESSTAAHEYAHRLQAAMPELDRFFNEEHEERTRGNSLRYLRDLTGLNYGRHEVTREDHYYHPYQGREYNHLPEGHRAAEVMTMVYEPLLGEMSHKNATTLKKLIQQDPDMLSLALGLLFHYKPKSL